MEECLNDGIEKENDQHDGDQHCSVLIDDVNLDQCPVWMTLPINQDIALDQCPAWLSLPIYDDVTLASDTLLIQSRDSVH